MSKSITVKTAVKAPIARIWEFWTKPAHITQWNHASPDWHTPMAVNNLLEGGKFTYRMEARDGSVGFDFEGTYTTVNEYKKISYVMTDGRSVTIDFEPNGETTFIKETFEPEKEHSQEEQQKGWQAILDNFRNYAEK